MKTPTCAARAATFVALVAVPALTACASGGAGAGAGGAPAPDTVAAQAAAAANQPWAIKTREHVDLWLHGFAMLQDDTARVPLFRRGYRDQMVVLKNRANVTTLLDANREKLRSRFAVNRQLEQAQFLALYTGSWEELGQAIQLFLQAEGDPSRAGSQQAAGAIATFAQYFPTPPDRDWLRIFAQSLQEEKDRYYHNYWVQQQRERGAVIATLDGLWQKTYRPKMQRFLNNTQQSTGSFVLSLPLDGEGRTIAAGKRENIVAVAFPESAASAAEAIYVFAHEVSGGLAATTVNDNTSPSDKRSGLAAGLQSAAAVRTGLILLERTAPDLADGYARYYLRSVGAPASGSPRASLVAAFPLPETLLAAISRQLDVVLGGI